MLAISSGAETMERQRRVACEDRPADRAGERAGRRSAKQNVNTPFFGTRGTRGIPRYSRALFPAVVERRYNKAASRSSFYVRLVRILLSRGGGEQSEKRRE